MDAGAIGIAARASAKPRRRLAEISAALRRLRSERAERAHAARVDGRLRSLPGSEHAHLIFRPRGF